MTRHSSPASDASQNTPVDLHPFVQRVHTIAREWVAAEWDTKQTIVRNAIALGWTSRRRDDHLAAATLTSQTLAARLDNISLSTLARALAQHGAPPPGKIIRTARLEYARDLLLTTKMMVRDIAHRAGYKSEKHFAEKFHAAFGCSPSEYRRSPTNAKTDGNTP
jgi:AraC-like DNA-binding protein